MGLFNDRLNWKGRDREFIEISKSGGRRSPLRLEGGWRGERGEEATAATRPGSGRVRSGRVWSGRGQTRSGQNRPGAARGSNTPTKLYSGIRSSSSRGSSTKLFSVSIRLRGGKYI